MASASNDMGVASDHVGHLGQGVGATTDASHTVRKASSGVAELAGNLQAEIKGFLATVRAA